jgi:phage gp46-like protein
MLRSDGLDIAVRVNPRTGKLRRVWDTAGPNKGNPRFDDDRHHAVWSQLFTRQGEYFADESGTHGSLLHTVSEGAAAQTPDRAAGYAEQSLAVLVQRGVIMPAPRVSATAPSPSRLDLYVTFRAPNVDRDQTVAAPLPLAVR